LRLIVYLSILISHLICVATEYESLRSNADILLKEKHDLEDKVVFLEASKASIEENADRILERNNALTRQFESLGVEYKKKSRLNAELLSKVDKIGKRMDCIRLENEQLASDNRTLRELYQRSARF
jgi:archaellum component FlaC